MVWPAPPRTRWAMAAVVVRSSLASSRNERVLKLIGDNNSIGRELFQPSFLSFNDQVDCGCRWLTL